MVRLILASQSPRRRELLGLCGYPFESMSADVDESSVSDADPAQDCIQTAQLKAEFVLDQISSSEKERTIVVAADTIVSLDDQILGKPGDRTEARQMLNALCGRIHYVHTGVAIIDLDNECEILSSHTAVVKMRGYSEQEITSYIATDDPLDKAGAYAIQHPVFRPVESLDGCYLGVMGLSICHLLQMLQQADLPFQADLPSIALAHQDHECALYDNIAQKLGK